MIGVDTNVLVRFLTRDEPGQHALACIFFEGRTPEDPAFLSAVTVAETIWVLRRSYGLPNDEILDSITKILDSDDFVVEGRQALESVRDGIGKASQLTDFLVAHLGARAGCTKTMTFDRRAAKSVPSMELLA